MGKTALSKSYLKKNSTSIVKLLLAVCNFFDVLNSFVSDQISSPVSIEIVWSVTWVQDMKRFNYDKVFGMYKSKELSKSSIEG